MLLGQFNSLVPLVEMNTAVNGFFHFPCLEVQKLQNNSEKSWTTINEQAHARKHARMAKPRERVENGGCHFSDI